MAKCKEIFSMMGIEKKCVLDKHKDSSHIDETGFIWSDEPPAVEELSIGDENSI